MRSPQWLALPTGNTALQVHYKQLIWQNGVKLGTGKTEESQVAQGKEMRQVGPGNPLTHSDKVCPWPTQCGCNSRQKAKSANAAQTLRVVENEDVGLGLDRSQVGGIGWWWQDGVRTARHSFNEGAMRWLLASINNENIQAAAAAAAVDWNWKGSSQGSQRSCTDRNRDTTS